MGNKLMVNGKEVVSTSNKANNIAYKEENVEAALDNVNANLTKKQDGHYAERTSAEVQTIINATSWSDIYSLLDNVGDEITASIMASQATIMNTNGLLPTRWGGLIKITKTLDSYLMVEYYVSTTNYGEWYHTNQFSFTNTPVWWKTESTKV